MPAASSIRAFLRAYAAHATLTMSMLSARLPTTTGRLLAHAHVASKGLPKLKLRGTRTYEGPGCSQQSSEMSPLQRMCTEATKFAEAGRPPSCLRPFSGSSTLTRTYPRDDRGLHKLAYNGPWRTRESGWIKLKEHSVVSKASKDNPTRGTSPCGIGTTSRTSSQTPSRILQIVQCAKCWTKSCRSKKKTPGMPPFGNFSCRRNSCVH
mmetsp:Transcript_44012/g.141111  ORF Transcript_44012/g.141111 Transcript_44012/m.141111 type:complete len:208 (+) Transcript_44012:508-1131(+)